MKKLMVLSLSLLMIVALAGISNAQRGKIKKDEKCMKNCASQFDTCKKDPKGNVKKRGDKFTPCENARTRCISDCDIKK